MKKNRKKMILSAAALTVLALFAGCTSANAASTTTAAVQSAPEAITLEEAKAIAYAHAGVSESDARDRSYEMDDGIYEIDFEHGGFEYDYDISRTGEVLRVEKEPERTAAQATGTAQTVQTAKNTESAQSAASTSAASEAITLEEAKAIAYAHAGVSESDALDKSYERDDWIYEIDFEHGGYDYDYDISRTGEILKAEKEPERRENKSSDSKSAKTKSSNSKSTENKSSDSKSAETKSAQTQRISAEKALSIAMNHAGVSNARDRDVEWDDGRWEVSFESGCTEYEYDISADGTIRHWEKDHDD